MTFVIELVGDALGCYVIPVVAERFSSRDGNNTFVDMKLVCRYGYDGLLRVNSCKSLFLGDFEFGKDNYLKVELPYPWSKHNLHANVPIKTYCDNSYFDSVIHWLKLNLRNLHKSMT